jgi:hypothetical protein
MAGVPANAIGGVRPDAAVAPGPLEARARGGGPRVPAAALTFTGEPRRYRSPSIRGSEAVRNFCPSCGGLVFGGGRGKDDSHTIYAGSLDDPARFRPTLVLFDRDRPDWAPLPPGLAVFHTLPD